MVGQVLDPVIFNMSSHNEQATAILDDFIKKLERERDEAKALAHEFYLACVYLDKAVSVYGATNTERIRIAADTIVRLTNELNKWRNWKPDAENLRELQEQARDKLGGYEGSLAASAAYIFALEAELRRLTGQEPASVEIHLPVGPMF